MFVSRIIDIRNTACQELQSGYSERVMDGEKDDIPHGKILGQWVRRRRKELNLTAEQVVGRMGENVPNNYVTQLENGGRVRMISQPRLGQLARALECSELDLVVGAGLITEALPKPGAPRELFERGTVKAEIVRILNGLNNDQAMDVLKFSVYIESPPEIEIPVILRDRGAR
jgi:transcriptional regulator with XRE-family HTH domain